MSRLSLSASILCLGLASACSGSPDELVPPDAPVVDAPPTTNTSELTRRAADAICGALYRCCDDGLVEYFAPYRDHELLDAYRNRLPPAAVLDEPGCRAVVEEMLDIVPLGDWVRAADAGTVTLDLPAFDACAATLASSTCGAQVRTALWDSTCLAFAAPAGGDEQRSFVRRTRTSGDPCSPVRDGLGGVFYGTCDPDQAFCCYAEAGQPGCQFPFDSDGTPRPGTCAAAAAVGAACSIALPLTLCATGNECSSETATCIAPSTAALSLGAACVDGSWHLLGECEDTWCDVLGSKLCEPLRDDAESCDAPEQCRSGRCESVCKPLELCDGSPTLSGGDAGVPTVPGETCAAAPALATASSPSPVAGYVSRVSGPLGATNDYNPLDTSGLSPGCSIVYDARGRDVAFAVTLAPGDRLRVRAELVDGKQAGIYLLDTCPAATWPDFDASTRCGSNEYNVGSCGIGGCDPAVLDVRYPLSLAGQPTTPRTFYLVIDEVSGATSSGFVIDWAITP